jgi:hypothetical protein
VLVDAFCQPGHAVIAVIGERLVPRWRSPRRATASPRIGYLEPLHRGQAWSMPTGAKAAAWEADAETDNRPLHVLFEIGRFEMPAAR